MPIHGTFAIVTIGRCGWGLAILASNEQGGFTQCGGHTAPIPPTGLVVWDAFCALGSFLDVHACAANVSCEESRPKMLHNKSHVPPA